MKIYNVGMVGFGFIGKVHAYGHLNIPLYYDQTEFRTRITHICTSRPETAEKGRAQVGALKAVTDFREITENPEIDIVDICTPNGAHLEALLSAMKHGKHIYCDKPLVADYAEAQQVREALKTYSATAQMTLQNRFFPATMRAKQLIEEGRIGDILEFRGAYLHSGSADPEAPLKWKLEAGTIADLGSHILDLLHSLVGDYAEVMAATHIAYPERPGLDGVRRKVTAEDNMMVLAKLPNGAAGQIGASKIATGAEDELSFEVHGRKGALRFSSMDPHHLNYYDAAAAGKPLGGIRGWTAIDCGQRFDPPGGFPTPKAAIGWMRSHLHCLYHFVDSVHRGVPGSPGLEQGIYIQYLMDRIKESAASGRWVDVRGDK